MVISVLVNTYDKFIILKFFKPIKFFKNQIKTGGNIMNTSELSKFQQFKETISVKDILGITVGCIIVAIAMQMILVPVRLLTGGVSGIAIMLKFVTSLDLWVWYVILNIPILVAGYRFISRRFALYSVLGIAVLSLFLGIFEKIPYVPCVDDLLICAVIGGVLNGLGTGIILRSKGSTGGMDIVAVIVKRYRGYNLGQVMFAVNIIIITIFVFIENINLAFYSGVGIFISSAVVDMVVEGLRVSKSAMIISEHAEEIAQEIMHNMHRGCTYLTGEGAYTGVEKKIIMVTVGKTQLPRLKEIVFQIDPSAFITINESIEVFGKGFTSSKAEF